jgi:CelD/BcsL family acetyltransferase involved in cellulose biosynthesis
MNELLDRVDAPRGTERESLSIDVVRNVESFANLRDEWEDLVQRSGGTIFQSFDWNILWWKHYGNPVRHRLEIVLIRSGETLIGICPMFAAEHTLPFGMTYRRLQFLGCGVREKVFSPEATESGPSDHLDLIVDPIHEDNAVSMLAQYIRRSSFDEIEWSQIPRNSLIIRKLGKTLAARGFDLSISRADICPYVVIDQPFENFVGGLRSSVRRRFSQSLTAVGTMFRVSAITSPEEFQHAWAALARLHQHHWNQLGFPGLFADPRFEAFQRDVSLAFLKSGRLRCLTAQHGQTTVAAQIAFWHNRTLSIYLGGFDKNDPSARRRPGLALILSMIRDLLSTNPAATIDFLRGDESYKFDFAPEVAYNWIVRGVPHRDSVTVRSMLYRSGKTVRTMIEKLANEWILLKVQYRTRGLLRCVPAYCAFRFNRAVRRLTGEQLPHPASSNS